MKQKIVLGVPVEVEIDVADVVKQHLENTARGLCKEVIGSLRTAILEFIETVITNAEEEGNIITWELFEEALDMDNDILDSMADQFETLVSRINKVNTAIEAAHAESGVLEYCNTINFFNYRDGDSENSETDFGAEA